MIAGKAWVVIKRCAPNRSAGSMLTAWLIYCLYVIGGSFSDRIRVHFGPIYECVILQASPRILPVLVTDLSTTRFILLWVLIPFHLIDKCLNSVENLAACRFILEESYLRLKMRVISFSERLAFIHEWPPINISATARSSNLTTRNNFSHWLIDCNFGTLTPLVDSCTVYSQMHQKSLL